MQIGLIFRYMYQSNCKLLTNENIYGHQYIFYQYFYPNLPKKWECSTRKLFKYHCASIKNNLSVKHKSTPTHA